MSRTGKRLFDLSVALVALVLATPVMLVVAVAVLIGMGRPVLFRQARLGLHGHPFTIVKFRSMSSRPGDGGPADDEQRLTRLGRWLRDTSLDELPSLWNVLRGEMSLVGPRPLPTSYRFRYTPTQFRRHEVRPGLTGLAQVNGRNGLSWEEKFDFDVWYVDHRSLALDLSILLRTVTTVLKRDGIAAPGTSTAHEFLGLSDPSRTASSSARALAARRSQ